MALNVQPWEARFRPSEATPQTTSGLPTCSAPHTQQREAYIYLQKLITCLAMD